MRTYAPGGQDLFLVVKTVLLGTMTLLWFSNIALTDTLCLQHWAERSPEAHLAGPGLFRVLAQAHQPGLIQFYLVAHLLALIYATFNPRSVLAMLPVIYFSYNRYYAEWPTQAGSTNLLHICLAYCLLSTLGLRVPPNEAQPDPRNNSVTLTLWLRRAGRGIADKLARLTQQGRRQHD